MFFGDGLLGRPARRLVPCLTGQPGTKIGPRDVPWADPWARSLFRPGTTARRAQSCRAHSCRADAGLGSCRAGPPVCSSIVTSDDADAAMDARQQRERQIEPVYYLCCVQMRQKRLEWKEVREI